MDYILDHVKIVKEPGFLEDLFLIFALKFEKQELFEKLENNVKRSENIEYYNGIIEEFEPVSDDLYLFFTPFRNGRNFLNNMTFTNGDSMPPGHYSVEYVQEMLEKYPFVIKKLIKFCFHELTWEEVEACAASNSKLFGYIKKSAYPDAVKNAMYEFFIEPIPYLQKLQYEIMAKKMQLQAYYEKNYSKLLDMYSNVSGNEQLREALEYYWEASHLEKSGQEFFLSFCLLNKNCAQMSGNRLSALYIFGYDYADSLAASRQGKFWLQLEEFGAAIGEQSRVGILKFIKEQGEVSCKDLEKAFNISSSTVYHHLTIMIKARLLSRRTEGKTIYYSINRTYMDAVVEELKEYSSATLSGRRK